MFSDDQLKSVKILASITKITNDCFIKCVNVNNQQVTDEEKICIEKCSDSYIKLRKFIQSQLFEDYQSIIRKNKQIYNEKT